jgi:DNA-binding NtrC family response regulator
MVLQDGRVRPLGSSREIAVDVKVVVASNRPLDEAVFKGRFRSDLYMRLSPATRVRIPSLSERPGDLMFLARKFAAMSVTDPDVGELRDRVADAVGLPAGTPLEVVMGRGGKRHAGQPTMELVVPGPAWEMLKSHSWPGNIREIEMLMHNIVTFTLVATVDAIQAGLSISSPRMQVDPGLVGLLLSGSAALPTGDEKPITALELDPDEVTVKIEAGNSLNAVANSVERQYFLELFSRNEGDFNRMSEALLGDKGKGRAVRLRFNQLGLKVREIGRR